LDDITRFVPSLVVNRRQSKEAECSALLRAAIAGDEGAYRQLLTNLPRFLHVNLRRTFDKFRVPIDDRDDVIQDVLLTFHLRRYQWNASLPLFPWLFTIARNKIIDEVRRRNRRQEVVVDFNLCNWPDVASEADPASDIAHDTMRALNGLSERNREIVSSIIIGGYSARELAIHLGMNETTVRVTLHRSLKALAEKHAESGK
jgi:RNA polymerase sigma-70 factor (ECF subfamily)